MSKPEGQERDRTNDPRRFHLNKVEANAQYKFKNNYVSTTKYTLYTYLPKGLYEQFRRVANFYFAVVAGLSCTELSPVRPYTTITPLFLVVGISMAKEAYEDYKRYLQDRQVNESEVQCFRNGSFVSTLWKEVRVGEIVKVFRGEYFCSDLLLLKSSNPEGACYVETMNLDGETNLKIKKAVDETHKLDDGDVNAMNGYIECDQPNNSIYTYTGNLAMGAFFASEPSLTRSSTIKLDPKTLIPLNPNQVLLRGASLRNTEHVVGAVIYTGHDTKVMKNATDPPSKRSTIEKGIDTIIFGMFFLLFIMCSTGAICSAVWMVERGDNLWYMAPGDTEFDPSNPAYVALTNVITNFILYGYLIPISLYVSLEMVKVVQVVFINKDRFMYHKHSDTPALARTSNLNEELGIVDTVLSDKTGTLTCNLMEFFKCSIAGTSYGAGVTEVEKAIARKDGRPPPVDPNPGGTGIKGFNFHDDRIAHWRETPTGIQDIHQHFFRLLGICHTVIPEGDGTEQGTDYQAESPDELAFVIAAREFGFFCNRRTATSVFLKEKQADGSVSEHEYEILNVLEFNSTRKRMSVIFRSSNGSITLYCKGADTVIYPRLRASGNSFKEVTAKHMEEYSLTGLRTLCLAATELDPTEYDEWQTKFVAAKTSLVDRAQKLDDVAELIEKDLVLLGSTAIEDKLQAGVPEAIANLAEAGIKLWMLTGDKQETAINIGFACSLLTNAMTQYIVNVDTEEVLKAEASGNKVAAKNLAEQTVMNQMTEALESIRGEASQKNQENALVIDGRALSLALLDNCKSTFLELGTSCKVVICCRVSPLQKAQITELVKLSGRTTIGIGDGANDVGMIQMANIGVGISGQEGMQAVMAADFAIAQFRFLERLLLVHGRWCYKRIGRMVSYFFYKNLMFGLTLFWFNLFCFFSGQPIFNDLYMSGFNVVFCALPIIVVGIVDQDVVPETAAKYPRIYQQGPKNEYFSHTVKGVWMLNGLYQSIVIVGFTLAAYSIRADRSTGEPSELYAAGTTMYTSVVLCVNLNLAMAINYWNALSHLVIWGSILVWFLFLVIYGAFPVAWSLEIYDLFVEVVSTAPSYYLIVIITTATALLPDLSFRVLQRTFYPQDHHILQEVEKMGRKGDPEASSSGPNGAVTNTPVHRAVQESVQLGERESPDVKQVSQQPKIGAQVDTMLPGQPVELRR